MPPSRDKTTPQRATREKWLKALANAGLGDLEKQWAAIADKPGYEFLRTPEIGLAMVRGRAGGTGQVFNLGEMTVTRCAIRVKKTGIVGFGYVAGRNTRHAELVAVFDALLQTEDQGRKLLPVLVSALDAKVRESREARAAKVAGTKVEFFTMVRGES